MNPLQKMLDENRLILSDISDRLAKLDEGIDSMLAKLDAAAAALPGELADIFADIESA